MNNVVPASTIHMMKAASELFLYSHSESTGQPQRSAPRDGARAQTELAARDGPRDGAVCKAALNCIGYALKLRSSNLMVIGVADRAGTFHTVSEAKTAHAA